MADVREIRRAQRADGPAAVLGIGTANPPSCVLQNEFADYYFRVTNMEHLADLKHTFDKICRATRLERRFFHHTEQVLNAIRLGEGGLDGNVSTDLPGFAAENLERCLLDALAPLPLGLGIAGGEGEWKWNDLFWVVHPGSAAILDHIDSALRLEPRKLAASRTVARDYGNMLSATVIFVLDELRRRRDEEGEEADAEWGVMVGFGPGFTVETMVLHAATNQQQPQLVEKEK